MNCRFCGQIISIANAMPDALAAANARRDDAAFAAVAFHRPRLSASAVPTAAATPPTAAEVAAAREDLARFLAGCYYVPGPELAEERLFESMLAATRRIDPAPAEHAQRLGQAGTGPGP